MAHQEVGLADAVRIVVDREPAAGHDGSSAEQGPHRVPLLGFRILGVDDDGTANAVEEVRDGCILVLVSAGDELLQERRVGQRFAGSEDIELDALGARLGEVRVPWRDLHRHNFHSHLAHLVAPPFLVDVAIVPVGCDTPVAESGGDAAQCPEGCEWWSGGMLAATMTIWWVDAKAQVTVVSACPEGRLGLIWEDLSGPRSTVRP